MVSSLNCGAYRLFEVYSDPLAFANNMVTVGDKQNSELWAGTGVMRPNYKLVLHNIRYLNRHSGA